MPSTLPSCPRSGGIDRVEAAAVDAFAELTMRLTEARFKPLFFRLLEWAHAVPAGDSGAWQGVARALCSRHCGGPCLLLPPSAAPDLSSSVPHPCPPAALPLGTGQLLRSVALFTLVNALAEKLRGVFVPYYALLLDACVAHLSGGCPLAGCCCGSCRRRVGGRGHASNTAAPRMLRPRH